MANKEFKANYNGEAIRPGEVMIPFEFTELENESYTNPECIKTVKQGGRYFKVIYKAVPEKWAKAGKSAFNLVQNEALGHYNIPNSCSFEGLQDDYEWTGEKNQSQESPVENMVEALKTFVELMKILIEKSAKIGYAVLLIHTGVKGEAFYRKMKLSRNPANLVQRQAAGILQDGLAHLDVDGIKCYKSQFDAEYRVEAYKLLNQIIEMYH